MGSPRPEGLRFLSGLGPGGGLLVRDWALARLDRTLGPDCPGGAACSSLSGNHAGLGAAAMVSSGRLEIRRTAVHDNVAEEDVLRAFSSTAPSTLVVEGPSLTGNAGESLIRIGDASLDVALSSRHLGPR